MFDLFRRNPSATAVLDEPDTAKSQFTANFNVQTTTTKFAPDPSEDQNVSEYGEQAFGMTRFGNVWLTMSEVVATDFDPVDGCGAEVMYRNGKKWHLNNDDAAALQKYMIEASTARDLQPLT